MKPFLYLCLALLAAPAAAQGWVRYAASDEATHYFDSLRTRKMGDTSFVWDLHDLQQATTDGQGNTYRSTLYATEFQCRAGKHRWLSISRHGEAMGRGAPVSEEIGAGEWQQTRPDSLAGQLFKHICE